MNNPFNVLITRENVEDILNKYGNIGNNGERLFIKDLTHYQKAFTHESYYQSVRTTVNFTKNDPEINSNTLKCYINYVPEESSERLEYLGDHILKAVMGRYLYERYPNEREGFLTDTKIKIEKCSMLHKISSTLGFKKYILLSLSIENQGLLAVDKGRNTPNYYEDSFEAFIGAISEDFGEMGYIYADRFTRNVIEEIVDFAELNSVNDNYKDTLVKTFVALKWPKPRFISINDSDVIHLKMFPKFITVDKGLLDDKQLLQVKDYNDKTFKKYKGREKLLLTCMDPNDLIAGIGYGRKNIQSEQECSRQALLNLGFSFTLKENQTKKAFTIL